ncbi:hypothetical protein Tco_0414310, partial [Tanacetum coccineum]
YGGNGNRNAGRQNRNQAFNASNKNDNNNQIVQRVPRTESTLGKENAVNEVNASSKVHEQVSHVKCKTIIQTSNDDQIDSNIIFDDPYVENNGITSEHDSNAHDEYHELQILAYNNQDLLITIYELKNKLRIVDMGKNVNTKFDKSETSGTLLCVTPLPKNIETKTKKVSNSKVNTDRSKLVISHPTPKNEQSPTQNENVLARGRCSKHMNGNLQLLRYFIEKFMGTFRFGNDHFAAITEYGDYVQGNLTICHVYSIEGLAS